MEKISLDKIKFNKKDNFVKKAVMIFGPKKTSFKGKILNNSTKKIDCFFIELSKRERVKQNIHKNVEELVFVKKGKCKIKEDGKRSIKCQTGDVISLPKNKKHSFEGIEKTQILVFHAPQMKYDRK